MACHSPSRVHSATSHLYNAAARTSPFQAEVAGGLQSADPRHLAIEHANLIDRATAERVAGTDAFVVPTLVTYDALHRHGRKLGFPDVSMAKLRAVREAESARSTYCRPPARVRHRHARPDALLPVARV